MKENSTNKRMVNVEAAVSVIVLYETLAAREQAVGFYEKFASQSPPSAHCGIHWHSFEDLTVSPVREKTAEAAAEADVIAFAVTSSGDLPTAVKLWTENWLLRRGEREGLLVGLVSDKGTEVRGVACLKEIYLRHLAHRAGMDYLSHFPAEIRKVMPDSLDSFIQRAERVTPVLSEILHTHFVTAIPPLK